MHSICHAKRYSHWFVGYFPRYLFSADYVFGYFLFGKELACTFYAISGIPLGRVFSLSTLNHLSWCYDFDK
jgi:hypothetical protein